MRADVELQLNSVERVVEFSHIESEAPEETDVVLPEEWPRRGAIVFDHVSVRYRENLDPVLIDVCLEFRAGEKIGIVGRTGSGKSTLALSIFRLIEADKTGRICIDDVDIATIGLRTLRSRIAIIPQDPVIFVGTVRTNLDPFSNHTDEEIWEALRISHIDEQIRKLDDQLETVTHEGGDQFSLGERQLICLARAVLRRPRVLLMDEATASVDFDTDARVQETVRSAFADSTTITIAHRLNGIMDADRVLVLDKGRVAEFAPPHELLADGYADGQGMLRGMVEQTGASQSAHLRALAEAAKATNIKRALELGSTSSYHADNDLAIVRRESTI